MAAAAPTHRQHALHRLVWRNEADALRQLLRDDATLRAVIDAHDIRGNTALHLCIMLGRRECLDVLIEHGASVMEPNIVGAYPVHEARSYGDRDIILRLLKVRRQQARDYFVQRAEAISKQLRELDDFYMEMRWDFSSWVPLLARFCPSDTLKIRKKGAMMRVDTTLVGFEGLRWLRGSISYIFNPSAHGRELTIIDFDKKIFEHVDGLEHDEHKLEERTSILLNLPIRYGELLADDIVFAPVRTGLLGFGNTKSELVGEHDAEMYTIDNVKLKTIARFEHLDPKLIPKDSPQKSDSASLKPDDTAEALGELLDANIEDDPKKREQVLKKLDGKKEDDVDKYVQSMRRDAIKFKPTLLPPPPPTLSEQQYFEPPGIKPGTPVPHAHVGRPLNASNSVRRMRATLWMSSSFPLFVEQLFPLMEIMAPSNEHFARLREFIDLKLPRGFPIKIEIPLFGILNARVTFQGYRIDSSFDDALFEIPSDFQQGEIKFFNN